MSSRQAKGLLPSEEVCAYVMRRDVSVRRTTRYASQITDTKRAPRGVSNKQMSPGHEIL